MVSERASRREKGLAKELAEEFQKQFTCLGENTEKCVSFTVPIEKEVTTICKIIYLTYYDLLIEQDLWQYHYQILSIFFLKEFIRLNVNTDMMKINLKLVELNIRIATVFLNSQTLKII